VVSCYEAGRDAFWVHRALLARGIGNVVVDAASIEVNRRQRRAKTDRLDARKLVAMLGRWHDGERGVWHVIYVPSEADEDRRQSGSSRWRVSSSSRSGGMWISASSRPGRA